MISYIDSGSGITSGFSGYSDDTPYTFGGTNSWILDYNDTGAGTNFFSQATGGGATHFVTITAVPEPNSIIMVSMLVLGLGIRRRRIQGQRLTSG